MGDGDGCLCLLVCVCVCVAPEELEDLEEAKELENAQDLERPQETAGVGVAVLARFGGRGARRWGKKRGWVGG